jgi:hypothetical protein
MHWMYSWNRSMTELTLLTHQPCEVDQPNCFCYKCIVPCDDGQIVSSRVLHTTFHICHVWKYKTCFLEFCEQQFDEFVFESCTWSLSMCRISLIAYTEMICMSCLLCGQKRMSGPVLHRECLLCPLKNELIVGNLDAVCDKRKFAVITNKNIACLKLQKSNVYSGG